MASEAAETPHLTRAVGPSQFFALGFGCIVGSAWVVVLGDWLLRAGPGGAIFGFLLGGAVMTIMAACYAELTARYPKTGGEFAYALALFGRNTAFLVGWFLALYLTAVVAFEAIALAWIVQTLFPQMLGPTLYEVMGQPITLDALAISMGGLLLTLWLNYSGVRAAARFQSIITYGFIVAIIVLIGIGLAGGDVENLQPLFPNTPESQWWQGAFWVFSTCALLLTGFQAIPQAIEERAHGTSLKLIGRITTATALAAALFYCLIVLSVSMAAPWSELAHKPLATAAAMDSLVPGGLLSSAVLLITAFSILKTWNAVVLMATRAIFAQAREGMLPAWLGAIDPRHGSPRNAILLVGVVGGAGACLGRAAVIPIVDMASMCLALTYVLNVTGLLVLRRKAGGQRPEFEVPGGSITILIGLVGVTIMAVVSVWEPLRTAAPGTVPLQYILIGAWLVLGIAFRLLARPRRQSADVAASVEQDSSHG